MSELKPKPLNEGLDIALVINREDQSESPMPPKLDQDEILYGAHRLNETCFSTDPDRQLFKESDRPGYETIWLRWPDNTHLVCYLEEGRKGLKNGELMAGYFTARDNREIAKAAHCNSTLN